MTSEYICAYCGKEYKSEKEMIKIQDKYMLVAYFCDKNCLINYSYYIKAIRSIKDIGIENDNKEE